MQHNIALNEDGFKPRVGGGGSKKGTPKKICWTIGVAALYKIAVQRVMETSEPQVVMSRKFNGQTSVEALLDYCEKHDPELFWQLRFSRCPMYPERTRIEMLDVLYHRGHKGFYWNEGEPHSIERAVHSPEHYSKSAKLRSRVAEAEHKFRSVLMLTKSKGKK